MSISKESLSNISLIILTILLIGLFYVSSLGCSCDENNSNRDNPEPYIAPTPTSEPPPTIPNHACVGKAQQTYVNLTFNVVRDGSKYVHNCDWSVTACGGEVMYFVRLENGTRQVPLTPGNQYLGVNKSDSSSGQKTYYSLMDRCYVYFVNSPIGEYPDLVAYWDPVTNTSRTEKLEDSSGYTGNPCEDEDDCRKTYGTEYSAYNCINGKCLYACNEQVDCEASPTYDNTYFCTTDVSDKDDASCVKYSSLDLKCTDNTECEAKFPSSVLTDCVGDICMKPCTDDSECYPSIGLYCLPIDGVRYCTSLGAESSCKFKGDNCIVSSKNTASVGETITFTVEGVGEDCEGKRPNLHIHRSCTIEGTQKSDIYPLTPTEFSDGISTATWTVVDGPNCPGMPYQTFARIYTGRESCSGDFFLNID